MFVRRPIKICYYVYLLKCADGTFYTGITNKLQKRIDSHQQGKGAKYTRGRTPVQLVYWEEASDKSAALKREYELRKKTHQYKSELSKEVNTQHNKEGT